MISDAERYAPEIAALVARFGEVPPLWARYPRTHPCHIAWRMGGGESYKYLFATWEAALAWGFDERLAYVRRWDPPFSWLESVAWFLWPGEFTDEGPELDDTHFERLASLGFGSFEDWSRCFRVGPDDYPLEDDRCSRWIEEEP